MARMPLRYFRNFEVFMKLALVPIALMLIGTPCGAEARSRKRLAKQDWVQCESAGGTVVLTPPLDCPYPGLNFDDFRARYERRVQEVRGYQ